MKPKEYLTDEQKDYIKKSAGKKYISEIARKLKIPGYRIYKYVEANHIEFKRVHGEKRKSSFPEGCFNPHERKNWLV